MSIIPINTLPPSSCPAECQGSEQSVQDLVQSVLNIRISHGVTMAACWIFIYPTGIVLARYFKGWSRWLEVHALLQKLGTTGAIGLVFANSLTRTGSDIYSFHSMAGFVILAGLICQICMGTVHKARLMTNRIDVPTVLKALPGMHALLGSCLLMLAPFQMVSGMRRYWGIGSPQEATYYVVIFIWSVIFCWLEYRKYKADLLSKSHTQHNPWITDEAYMALKLMTWEDIVRACSHDAEWIVIRGICYDVRTWRAAHPGGQGRLIQMFGHDATDMFTKGPHAHSSTAWKKMASLAVGRLDENEPEAAKARAEQFMFQLVTVTQMETIGNFKRITCAFDQPVHFVGPGEAVEKPTDRKESGDKQDKSALSKIADKLGGHEKTDEPSKLVIFPGQYCILKASAQDEQAVRQLERPYTPFASSFLKIDVAPVLTRTVHKTLVDPSHTFDLIIKGYKHGKMSKLVESFKVGSQLSVRGPLGVPVRNEHSPDGRWSTLFLVAGGSGITPMLQYLNYHIDYEEDTSNRDTSKWPVIHLIWCARDNTAILASRLTDLETRSKGYLRVTMPNSPEYAASSVRPAFERVVSGKSSTTMPQVQLTSLQESSKLTQPLLEIAFAQTYDDVRRLSPSLLTSAPNASKAAAAKKKKNKSEEEEEEEAAAAAAEEEEEAKEKEEDGKEEATKPSKPPPRPGSAPKWELLFGKKSTKVLVCGPPGFTEAAGDFSKNILGPELSQSALHFF